MIALALHLRVVRGDFLSDDFSHIWWISEADRRGELLRWLGQLFYLPLESGNFAYRPIVFASYGLDWLLYGTNPSGWHATNLVIHLLNGAMLFRLARDVAAKAQVGDALFVGTSASALHIAIPFAGESTFWPVGRFDLLACFFSLLFLRAVLLSGTKERRVRWVAGAFLIFALLSKESAMPMLVVGAMLLYAQQWACMDDSSSHASRMILAARKTFDRYWPVLFIATLYLGWRLLLFGSAWKVYPDSQWPQSLQILLQRVSTLAIPIQFVYAPQAIAVTIVIGVAVLVWLFGARAAVHRATLQSRVLTLSLLAATILYFAAPASSFPIAAITGEGMRNLYLPWMLLSVFVAMAVGGHERRVLILLLLLLVSFVGQARMLRVWGGAAHEMALIKAAIPAMARTVPEHQFALALLPDHIEVAPFARNAQGALFLPPQQETSHIARIVTMTPLQFAEWEKHFDDNTIGRIKGPSVVFDRNTFFGVFCWLPARQQFQLLNARPVIGDAPAWERRTLAEGAQRECLL